MAKAQYPIEGRLGKDWKITSEMGWRIHPVQKTKKHHNGADIIGLGKGPHYIEAPYDGKVLKATKSTAPGGGFGNYVVLYHKINGKHYTTLYAHLKEGSIKVKKGQKVEAGTVLGIMGTTGMSTGVHLHWEMWSGKTHGWSADGSGFVNAVKFFKALIAQEKELSATPKATEDTGVVAPPPTHEEAPAPAPVAKPAVESPTPTAKPKAKAVMYTVKSGDSYWAIAEKYHGKFGGDLALGQYVKKIQTWNKSAPLNPGDKVRVN